MEWKKLRDPLKMNMPCMSYLTTGGIMIKSVSCADNWWGIHWAKLPPCFKTYAVAQRLHSEGHWQGEAGDWPNQKWEIRPCSTVLQFSCDIRMQLYRFLSKQTCEQLSFYCIFEMLSWLCLSYLTFQPILTWKHKSSRKSPLGHVICLFIGF